MKIGRNNPKNNGNKECLTRLVFNCIVPTYMYDTTMYQTRPDQTFRFEDDPFYARLFPLPREMIRWPLAAKFPLQAGSNRSLAQNITNVHARVPKSLHKSSTKYIRRAGTGSLDTCTRCTLGDVPVQYVATKLYE